MSYILDALKKSDQERQQGTSPNLLSVHGSIPPAKYLSPFKRHQTLWLISGGILFLFTCLGIFLFLHQQDLAERDSTKATDTPLLSAELQTPQTTTTLPQPSDQTNATSPPLVLAKEKNKVLLSIAVEDRTFDPPTVIETGAAQKSLPLLKDLSAKLQAEIPSLKFAGHTYSENPSQRMIIINGKILREGDMIAPNTHLTEISWEGVTIEFNGTRFLVKTN